MVGNWVKGIWNLSVVFCATSCKSLIRIKIQRKLYVALLLETDHSCSWSVGCVFDLQ